MQRVLAISISVLLISLALYGCGKGAGGKESGHPPVIRIAGSTSMMPISEKLARAYEIKHPGVKIHIEGGDSSLGIRGVMEGILDIGSVSRPLTEEEKNSLKSYKITEDSVRIIVNEKNPVRELTINQAREVFSSKVTNWSNVGGLNRPITVISREKGSGTHSIFEDIVMGKEAAVDEKAVVMTSTGAVLGAVMRDVNAIGYVSSNYQAGGIKTLEIHTGENKVFVLSRTLLYVTPAGVSELTRDYLEFCAGPEGKKIVTSHQEK
ncbi:MAG: substrate-binding domain-containing protein [Bacillota bacterium]